MVLPAMLERLPWAAQRKARWNTFRGDLQRRPAAAEQAGVAERLGRGHAAFWGFGSKLQGHLRWQLRSRDPGGAGKG